MPDTINRRYLSLLSTAREMKLKEADLERIKKAFHYAKNHHRDQLRKSGEPFIIHPLETAIRLASWKMDADTIIAGLLHDVVEDTTVTTGDVETNFGKQVAGLVTYVTKISTYSQERRRGTVDTDRDDNYLRQIYQSIAEDPRAIVVKLADRMHNMETLDFVGPEKRIKIATETLNIYGELAGRLGMYEVKSRLQDMAFKHMDPRTYAEIAAIAEPLYKRGETVKKQVIQVVKNALGKSLAGDLTVKDRNKSVYSIYRKISGGIRLEDVRDVVAVRFIVGSVQECYAVLGVVHTNFKIVDAAFKDYIANPKANMYQSLHTTVVDPNNTFCEVQIRTRRMDELADYGIAAHWRYKDHDLSYTSKVAERIKGLAAQKGDEGLSKVQRELRTQDIIVFLKNNPDSIPMPKGSTVLDLAYRVGPKKFFYVAGAKVNNANVSIASRLTPNAVVQLFYSKQEAVTEQWVNYVANEKAVADIQAKLARIDRTRSNAEFHRIMSKARTEHEKNLLNKRIAELGFKNYVDFVRFLKAEKTAAHLLKHFYGSSDADFARAAEQLKPAMHDWFVSREYVKPHDDKIFYTSIVVAPCCTKVPGEHIVGVMEDEKIVVHNVVCPRHAGKKVVEMVWNEARLEERPRLFRANLAVDARWIEGLVNEIVKIVLDSQANVNTVSTLRDKPARRAAVEMMFYVKNKFALDQIIAKIGNIPQVITVQRIT